MPKPESISVADLLDHYLVDPAHARHVANLSLVLFDLVAERYGLNPEQRHLIEIAALLHNVGLRVDPPNHHLVGRDIVLRHRLAGLTKREQLLVAALVAFHRKRVRASLEPAYLALGRRAQQEALRLAAILRVADGLDYSHTQQTSLIATESTEVGLRLFLRGPRAAEDAGQALAKADLWQRVFGEALQTGMVADESDQPAEEVVATPSQTVVEVVTGGEAVAEPVEGAVSAGEAATKVTEPIEGVVSVGDEVAEPVEGAVSAGEAATGVTQPLALPASGGETTADDRVELWYASSTVALAELGRILLRRHLRRLRSAEREVRADSAVEAVHDLRVATRRLRSTLHLLAPVYAGDNWRALNRGVGQIGRAAGAVRDRDVLLADLAIHASALPADSLADLQQRLGNERAVAHAALINFLDDERYARFIRRFARVMNDLSVWDNRPRVRDLGGSTIWRHYEALRAHDQHGLPAAIEDLHLMRIDGKRMRYVLELFTDTLGPSVDELVQPLVAFQDHLGVLNDIVVASVLLAPHADDVSTGPAVMGYIALREQQANAMLAELPACWAQLAGEAYRSQLAGLIAQL